MSKPKNRIMCPDCRKPKMLFETQKKADMFIHYNKDEMEYGEQLRSYYCPSCCGWHITHMAYSEEYENRTERLIEEYNNITKFKYIRAQQLFELLEKKGLKNRPSVRKFLKTIDEEECVKQEAIVKYYKMYNLKKYKK